MPDYNLALFDLDHTLLPLDSDNTWSMFLAEHSEPELAQSIKDKSTELMGKYNAGILQIEESIAFMLGHLKCRTPYELAHLHEQYMQLHVRPSILPQAIELVQKHHEQGDLCCLVSATNSYVIGPIGRAFGFEHIIGTTPEYKNGRFTGKHVGTPSFQAGKITRVNEWLAQNNLKISDFTKSYFYSDSINDLPLLEVVTDPICCNPADDLRQIGQDRNWKIIDLF